MRLSADGAFDIEINFSHGSLQTQIAARIVEVKGGEADDDLRADVLKRVRHADEAAEGWACGAGLRAGRVSVAAGGAKVGGASQCSEEHHPPSKSAQHSFCYLF